MVPSLQVNAMRKMEMKGERDRRRNEGARGKS